jgi:hypothetical protein
MMSNRLTALAVLGFALSSGAAFAAPNAYMLADTNVRQTSNPGSAVVNFVEEDQEVEVVDCAGTRCKIKIPGPDGWVPANRLGDLDEGGDPDPGVPFSFGFSFGGGDGPSISFGVGDAPPPPASSARVCFFRNPNYGGANFCAYPGDSDDSLGGSFNDRISSIRVYGGAEVTVCRNNNLSGVCADYSSNKPTLPASLNDRISSFEVY